MAAALTIDEIELRRVAMRLREPFRTSHGVETVRDVLLVRVTANGFSGWGECAASRTPGYTAETTDSAHALLRDRLVPDLLAEPAIELESIDRVIPRLAQAPMARAALEQAVLDTVLRSSGVSLAAHLGATRSRVEVGAAIGIEPTIEALVERAVGFDARGYRRLKLKIQPGWDVEPVRAVRAALPDRRLHVDANGSYTLDDLETFRALDRFDLLCVEQPLRPRDLAAHAELASLIETAVCLDETITDESALESALAVGACSIVCLKPGRVGGFRVVRRLHDRCVDAGIELFCGGMLETGIGRAGALAVAALPGCALPADLSGSDRYWAHDLAPFFLADDGIIDVPAGPGIGVEVDQEFLGEITTEREAWIAP